VDNISGSCKGYKGYIVPGLAEKRPEIAHHADHAERVSVDLDLGSYRIFVIREECFIRSRPSTATFERSWMSESMINLP